MDLFLKTPNFFKIMRVMGIDPGSKCTGCGIIEEIDN